jgi:hypothetical protein
MILPSSYTSMLIFLIQLLMVHLYQSEMRLIVLVNLNHPLLLHPHHFRYSIRCNNFSVLLSNVKLRTSIINLDQVIFLFFLPFFYLINFIIDFL